MININSYFSYIFEYRKIYCDRENIIGFEVSVKMSVLVPTELQLVVRNPYVCVSRGMDEYIARNYNNGPILTKLCFRA